MANNRGRYLPISLTSPGSAIVLGFIALAVGMGILFTRGVAPKSMLSDPGQTGDLEVIPETPDPAQKGLQLKTIRFKECANKVNAGFLLDRSSSMQGPKITEAKNAITTFVQKMGDQSVVGLYSFSSPDNPKGTVSEEVPFSRYGIVKVSFPPALSQIAANGNTYTRVAFTFVKDKIIQASKDFPDNKTALIFLSDGIPHTAPEDCSSGRSIQKPGYKPTCYANSQDPTLNGDLSQEIKDAGIRIFAIAIYDALSSEDQYFLPDMRTMMKKVSSPDSYYETPNPTELQQIYSDIATKICNEVK